MLKHLIFLLPVASVLVGAISLAPAAPASAQTSPGGGVLLRALLIAPVASGSPGFWPGPPIREAPLQSEDGFLGVLRQRNPRWAVQSLGALQIPATSETVGLSNGDVTATASIAGWQALRDGSLSCTLHLEMDVWNAAVSGRGVHSDNLRLALPANEAFVIARMKDDDQPAEVVVFASLLSDMAISRRPGSNVRIASRARPTRTDRKWKGTKTPARTARKPKVRPSAYRGSKG